MEAAYVDLSRTPGVTIKQIAEELGIAPNMLSRWRRELSQDGNQAFQGQGKVRYRGLEKNTAQLTMLFALSNLYMVRRQLLVSGDRCAAYTAINTPGTQIVFNQGVLTLYQREESLALGLKGGCSEVPLSSSSDQYQEHD